MHFADFPVINLRHLDVVDAGLEILENDVVSGSFVESIRFMNNRISIIEEYAFRSVAKSLKSLDLSYNNLNQIPLAALSNIQSLDWLNLHHNAISIKDEADSLNLFKETLSTLFLGENSITQIPHRYFSTYRRLLWLNLDKNYISTIPDTSFSSTILTLSLSYNYLSTIPQGALENMPALMWCTLRGNKIEALPLKPFSVPQRKLDKFDLGENFITSIPAGAFNGTLNANDLNLDYNYIEVLNSGVFKALQPRRLYLSTNRIKQIDDAAFEGLEDILELIDLEGNRLNNVTHAFNKLRRLRYLYLSKNNISVLIQRSFKYFCNSLRVLSLSKNSIGPEFPREALQPCKSLSHLNLGYNKIKSISKMDFVGWATNLDTLILRSNNLNHITSHTFQECVKLRELSLSFNDFTSIGADVFSDIDKTLESIEISFGLQFKMFPETAIKPLQKLLWLSLDNNNIKDESISETALYNQGELQYLNMESNNLKRLTINLLHKNVHKNLIEIRLSYNKIHSILKGTFNSLDKLRLIQLTGNKVRVIETMSFQNLPNLLKIFLSYNKIRTLSSGAFINLPNLQKVELQNNELSEFSLNVFENCSIHPANPLLLNLSHNLITRLKSPELLKPPHIRILDISYNNIKQIEETFHRVLAKSLRIMHVNHNKITYISKEIFNKLSQLQILILAQNKIVEIEHKAMIHLKELQVLDVSFNSIQVLKFKQFAGLTSLRIVSLSHNKLRSLPSDVFEDTSISDIDLSSNEFVALPSSSLEEIADTLRYLDISHNRLEHLDSTMFSRFSNLLSLSLSNNYLTILPDNIFGGLGRLMSLDISYNFIRANFKELFHYVQRIQSLNLESIRTDSLNTLPLNSLTYLNLAHNHLDDLPYLTIENLISLRFLNISHNSFSQLPNNIWYYLQSIQTLDISWNPIRVLTKESFDGLSVLKNLYVHDLPDLKRFDGDSLSYLNCLTELFIQSWPSIERYKFRLGSVISGIPSLRKISAKITEPSGVLSDQLLGAFGPKLKELHITGPLHTLSLNAFEGIEGHELLLMITDTYIKELPTGFMSMFSNVAHLSLDFRNNKLTSILLETFYADSRQWKSIGTELIEGGVALQNNPWTCSCNNVWLGHWLQRWMRESLQLHTNAVERSQSIQLVVRSIVCDQKQQDLPLVELESDTYCANQDKLNGNISGQKSSWSLNRNMIMVLVLQIKLYENVFIMLLHEH